MRIVAITQARMGSTRLPGKVLMDLAGKPMLVRHVERANQAALIHELVVATSTEAVDDIIADLCEKKGWLCFRGNESDVLDRYYRAALWRHADFIIRITSDCPLIDPGLIDEGVAQFTNDPQAFDYLSNRFPRQSFPRGLDYEIFTFPALERVWREDTNPLWREHVTPYFYRNPHLFKIGGITYPEDHSTERWTVDTKEDLAFVRKIYEHFCDDQFSWTDVLALLNRHPDWREINRHVRQKEVP